MGFIVCHGTKGCAKSKRNEMEMFPCHEQRGNCFLRKWSDLLNSVYGFEGGVL